jgi:hypothetical protein
LICDVIQSRIDVHKSRWINERPGVPPQVGIVPVAAEETGNFLHVGDPIDLSVCTPGKRRHERHKEEKTNIKTRAKQMRDGHSTLSVR